MLPADLPLEPWRPPGGEPRNLVVLTAGEPRHDRFALRLLDTFGERVLDWYRVAPRAAASPATAGRAARARGWWTARRAERGTLAAAAGIPRMVLSRLERRRLLRRRARRQRAVELELFGAEIAELRARIGRGPTVIDDPNDRSFVERVDARSPWLLVSLGGPLYRRPLLRAVRGAAINQHAGWSPSYRGTNTTDWALYHRDLARVGNTVHVATLGADAGPILRRSHPCLVADDSPESVFARVVALGTELLIEVVGRLLAGEAIPAAAQPPDAGRTYLARELAPVVVVRTARDFDDGWLGETLARAADW